MDFVTINPTPISSPATTIGQFAKTVYFNNRSGLTVKVNYPNGEHVTIPTIVEQLSKRVFEIHVEYHVEHGCSLATVKEMIGDAEFAIVERGMATNRKTVRIRYDVTDITMLEDGKGIFLESLAMALTDNSKSGCCYPKGIGGITEANNFDLKIVVVDYNGVIEGHYIKFLDYIFEAGHSSGTGLGDGIYLMSTFRGEATIQKYDLDPDIGPIRVFRSLTVAKEYEGGSTLAERLQLEKEQLSIEKVKLEKVLINDKAIAERVKNEQELIYRERLNALESEKKVSEGEYKEREYERKDYYDQRSTVRKDSSEAAKWLPAIISAMGVLFGLLT